METPYTEGKQHQTQLAELDMCIRKLNKLNIVQLYTPKTSHPEEDINRFCNDVYEILQKPNHYNMVMGDFNAEIAKRTNPIETATDRYSLEL